MSKSPTLRTLLEESQTVTNWDKVGVFLGLDERDIKTIEHEYNGSLRKCRLEMLNKWLEKDPSPTWEKYCEALEKASHGAIAMQVREKYCQHHLMPPLTKMIMHLEKEWSSKTAEEVEKLVREVFQGNCIAISSLQTLVL